MIQGKHYLLLLGLLFFWGCAQSGAVRPEADVQAQARDLLKAEPELILGVLREHPLEFVGILEQAVLAKREHEQKVQEQADLATPRNPEISETRPMRGNSGAAITIVEYSDFLCPYCSTATATIKELMAENDGSVRLVFKHFPLNPVSRELALAFEALALQNQESAWRLHDLLFERQGEARADFERMLTEFVRDSGADGERFAADRKSPEVADLVDNDMEEARRFGFNGTPMFLINGIPVRGAVPLREFQRVMELARSKSAAPATQ